MDCAETGIDRLQKSLPRVHPNWQGREFLRLPHFTVAKIIAILYVHKLSHVEETSWRKKETSVKNKQLYKRLYIPYFLK